MLAHKGIDFVDRRFDFDEWKNVKGTGEFGPEPSLPMYISGDKKIKLMQAGAILQYLATIHGLVPKTPDEVYENTWFFETEHDFKSKPG